MSDKGHAVKDGRRDLPFMVHSELDDLDLSPYEFRAYVHLVRRAGDRQDGEYWESVEAGAAHCRMNVKTYRAALAGLVERRLITKRTRPGETTVYRLTPASKWKRTPTESGRTPLPKTVGHPYQIREDTPTESGRTPLPNQVDKGNPLKGIPRRDKETPLPPKTKKPKFDPLKIELPPGVSPDTWADFVGHRTDGKAPLTERATKIILRKLAETPHDANAMLETSIQSNWTGVYPLKKPKHQQQAAPPQTGPVRFRVHDEVFDPARGQQAAIVELINPKTARMHNGETWNLEGCERWTN